MLIYLFRHGKLWVARVTSPGATEHEVKGNTAVGSLMPRASADEPKLVFSPENPNWYFCIRTEVGVPWMYLCSPRGTFSLDSLLFLFFKNVFVDVFTHRVTLTL